MTRVLSMISAKGGSGKTVITLSTAKLLNDLGHKILVVDADAATNGATLFLLEDVLAYRDQVRKVAIDAAEAVPVRGLFEAGASAPTIIPTHLGFDFVPAAFQLRDTVRRLLPGSVNDDFEWLLGAIEPRRYDLVLVDNEAGVEQTAVIAAALSDRVIIVSEFDPISFRGISRLQRLHGDALPEGQTWVLFNKVLPEFADSISDSLIAIKYLPPVAWAADVVRAYAVNEIDVNVLVPNDFTLAIANFAESALGTTIRRSFAEWRTTVVKRYETDLAERRDILVAEQEHREKRLEERSRRVVALGFAVLVSLLVVALIVATVATITSTIPIAIPVVIAGLVTVVGAAFRWGWRAMIRAMVFALEGQVEIDDDLPRRLTEINLLLASSTHPKDFATLRERIHALETVEVLGEQRSKNPSHTGLSET